MFDWVIFEDLKIQAHEADYYAIQIATTYFGKEHYYSDIRFLRNPLYWIISFGALYDVARFKFTAPGEVSLRLHWQGDDGLEDFSWITMINSWHPL